MDQGTLVKDDVAEGAKLISALDASGFEVSSALWLYSSEHEDWRLIIATPLVDKEGPRATYRMVQRVLRKTGLNLDLRRIGVVSPSDSLIQVLRRAIKTDSGISNIRFSRNVVDGIYIEDAVLYRVQ